MGIGGAIIAMDENKPFSVTKLAGRWETTRQTIHNQIKSGEIKNTFKVGNMVRIPYWEVERVESCGTNNQNSTEENTTPGKEQEIQQRENRYEPTNWMWQQDDCKTSERPATKRQ